MTLDMAHQMLVLLVRRPPTKELKPRQQSFRGRRTMHLWRDSDKWLKWSSHNRKKGTNHARGDVVVETRLPTTNGPEMNEARVNCKERNVLK